MTLSRITLSPSIGERPGPYRTVASMTDPNDQTITETPRARLTKLSRSIAGKRRSSPARRAAWGGRRRTCSPTRAPGSPSSTSGRSRARRGRRDPRRARRRTRRSASSATSATRRSCTRWSQTCVGWAGASTSLVNNAGISLINSAFQDEDELRDQLGADARRQPHRPRPADPPVPAVPPRGRRGPRRQHRLDRGDRHHRRLAAYTATKAGVVGLTKSFAVELGRHGHHRQLHLPGPDQHRHDRRHRRRGEGDLRQAARPAAPLRRPRGGGPDDAQPVPAGGQLRQRRHHPRRRRHDASATRERPSGDSAAASRRGCRRGRSDVAADARVVRGCRCPRARRGRPMVRGAHDRLDVHVLAGASGRPIGRSQRSPPTASSPFHIPWPTPGARSRCRASGS